MGLTQHGIKYPEYPDIPNVPDDIGGIAKLNQSSQAWLAQLDTTNLANLSAANSGCASSESTVTTIQNGINTGTGRQNNQVASVGAIRTRNDNINARLNNRDTTLASDNSIVNGFPGTMSALNVSKGRGLIARTSGILQVAVGQSLTPFIGLTFNDPNPNASRVYRVCLQMTVQNNVSSSFYATIGVGWHDGTGFSGSANASMDLFLASNQNTNSGVLDVCFTGMSSSQWSISTMGFPVSGSGTIYYMTGTPFCMTLEDIGLQL